MVEFPTLKGSWP